MEYLLELLVYIGGFCQAFLPRLKQHLLMEPFGAYK
jgi:hypothetical protein